MKKNKKRKHPRGIGKIQLLAICIFFLSILLLWSNPLSSPSKYRVERILETDNVEFIATFSNFSDAKAAMHKERNAKLAKNARVLDSHNRVVAIGYGIVDFKTKPCNVNTQYTLDSTTASGYINGCYGADGAYLDTSDDGTKVKFKQAGAVGWVSIDDVRIKNYTAPEIASINHYTTENSTLLHHITKDVNKNAYQAPIELGSIQLANNVYYSYDGHYFYATFPTMIDDYRKGTYKNSMNQEPYYNFYQYVSHRSKSAYQAQDIDRYLEQHAKLTNLQIDPQGSLLFKSGQAFITAQNKHGANAIMMLSLAMNESNYGRSKIALEKHNVFGHAAYDASPGKSATSYKNVEESIQAHAIQYLQKGYLNPDDKRFFGGFFGDKASGMNVRYASDPYWGEKAARHYRLFDTAMGNKDSNALAIRVINKPSISIYQQPNTQSNILYTLQNIQPFAYTIRKSNTAPPKWYAIQSDFPLQKGAVIKQSEVYSFSQSTAYIVDD